MLAVASPEARVTRAECAPLWTALLSQAQPLPGQDQPLLLLPGLVSKPPFGNSTATSSETVGWMGDETGKGPGCKNNTRTIRVTLAWNFMLKFIADCSCVRK
jgi:hypothetical protein